MDLIIVEIQDADDGLLLQFSLFEPVSESVIGSYSTKAEAEKARTKILEGCEP